MEIGIETEIGWGHFRPHAAGDWQSWGLFLELRDKWGGMCVCACLHVRDLTLYTHMCRGGPLLFMRDNALLEITVKSHHT